MSGYKRATVKISEEEYRRLHEADKERRFKEHAKNSRPSRQTAELTDALREMENRQQHLEQAFRDIDRELGWMGTEAIQQFLSENARCYENLATMIEEASADASVSLDLLSQRFDETLQREREQYQYHLLGILQRLNAHEQNEQSKAQAARRWLRQCVALGDHLQERFDHQRFLPGQLTKILGRLNLAQDNLAEGLFETSIQASQQVFMQLSDFRLELEQRILDWKTHFGRAQSALTQFVTELEMNASVNALGLQGEELPEQVDLSYWSYGTYRDLLDKSRRLLRLLSQEQRSISTEELKRTCDEFLPLLTEKFESMIYEARLSALNSQLRMNIAETALQALETQGFTLSTAGYANQDMRAAFTADLESPDGSRVQIEVIPAQKTDEELSNDLVMTTHHHHLKTEQEARLQWQELCRTLGQYDLQVTRPEILPTPPGTAVDRSSIQAETRIPFKRHHNVR
jgi:hypothetical protein